jgi:hypothetical protein
VVHAQDQNAPILACVVCISDDIRNFICRSSGRWLIFYECSASLARIPYVTPTYLVAPVQGDHQVQEVDIPELSHDELDLLLDSSDVDLQAASEGSECEFPP